MSRIAPAAVAGFIALAIVPSAAHAATAAPTAVTGLAGSITPQGATLTARVNPQGLRTSYRFDYGLSKKYTARTGSQKIAPGGTPVAATAGVSGLASNRVYHYRIVASNAKGTVRGADQTFKTPKQPLGFSVAVNPNPILFGDVTTVAGTLGGTGSTNRAVQLQANAWPFTAGFVPLGNAQLTNATGSFAFPVLGLGINTQFRVVTTGEKPTVSPVVTGNVLVKVTAKTRVKTVNRGSRLRFSGTVRPAHEDVQIGIQRRSNNKWLTVSGSRTRPGTVDYSRYATRVKINRGGLYRVFVKTVDGRNVSHYSPEIELKTRR